MFRVGVLLKLGFFYQFCLFYVVLEKCLFYAIALVYLPLVGVWVLFCSEVYFLFISPRTREYPDSDLLMKFPMVSQGGPC